MLTLLVASPLAFRSPCEIRNCLVTKMNPRLNWLSTALQHFTLVITAEPVCSCQLKSTAESTTFHYWEREGDV